METKEKKEVEHLAKLAEKEKEKEEKAKAKGKKKAEGGALVPTSLTVDQGSQMEGPAQSEQKKKVALTQLTEDVITHGT